MANDTLGAETLTGQQLDILELLASGSTNSEIAAELGLPLNDVKAGLVSIMTKLGATSREAAVEAWRRKQRRTRTLKGAAIGGGVLAIAVVAALLMLNFLGGSDSDDAALAVDPAPADLEVRVVNILAPNPGVRILELPGGRESFFAQTGIVSDLRWSPTNENALVRFEEPPGLYATVNYESGTTKVFSINDGGLMPRAASWSPDGELIFFYPHWAFSLERERDIEFVPAYIYSSAGDRVASVSVEQLTDTTETDLGGTRICLGNGNWSVDSDFVLVRLPFDTLLRVSVDGDVTVINTLFECEDVPPLLDQAPLAWFPSPYPDLVAIEARIPTGARVVSTTQLWPTGFAATVEGSGEAAIPTTLVSIGGRPFEFEGSAEGAQFLILGADDLRPPGLPSLDTSGCPLDQEVHCQAPVRAAMHLFEGDVESVIGQAAPELVNCEENSSSFDDLCAQSSSGLPLAAFSVRDETGVTDYVSAFELRLILGELAGQLASADGDAVDDYGSGAPRIVGFTCGPWEGEFACYRAAINITWIQDGPGGSERRVVGLSFMSIGWNASFGLTGMELRGPGGEYDIALAGGEVNTGNWRSRRRGILWAPPAAD